MLKLSTSIMIERCWVTNVETQGEQTEHYEIQPGAVREKWLVVMAN